MLDAGALGATARSIESPQDLDWATLAAEIRAEPLAAASRRDIGAGAARDGAC